MITIKVARVFSDQNGNYGNPVGIVIDTAGDYSDTERQSIAARSGFSETVFVNDLNKNVIRIFTAQQEIPFAGHAVVGAVAFLEREFKKPINQVVGSQGNVDSWSEGNLTWVKAELRVTPPWWHERLDSAQKIDSLSGAQSKSQSHVQLWAWIKETDGTVRSRTFAPGWGIPEDEANGSGCMRLAAALGRPLVIHHGAGSIIHARPSTPGHAEVGGQVVMADDLVLT